MKLATVTLVAALFFPSFAPAQDQRTIWNLPQDPFRIHGNVYYVGPRGLAAVLITSDAGHILIDGALPESVPAIVERIRTLGFRVEDIKLIVNSHVHFDHAGGIGELQRMSKASVAATPLSAKVLESGKSGPNHPQFGLLDPIARVPKVRIVKDGETLRVGQLAVTAHATGGHSPGGTSWSFKSCEASRCVDVVYADSLTSVSADGFFYTRTKEYPEGLTDFEKGFATLSTIPCDILITTHPDASDLLARLAKRTSGESDAMIDPTACKRLAESARRQLRARVERETKQP